jgi:preprotein translocase subunit YajC
MAPGLPGNLGTPPRVDVLGFGGWIMNTIGKILVILNFLFAVVVGLFLVLYIANQNKSREAHEETLRNLKVMEESYKTTRQVIAKLTADYRTVQLDAETAKQALKEAEDRRKMQEDEYIIKIQERDNLLKDKDLTNAQSAETVKRMSQEIGHLTSVIKDRETAIVRIEADLKKLRSEAVQFEALARARQIRAEALLEQVQELTLALKRERAGVVNADVMVIRNPNEPNPPPAQVNGKVEKVEGDLMQISLGTDHGVLKNHTLDVYRLTPEPKYLGMVRIVDANHHQSVARLVPVGNAQFRTPLRVGDLVTSKLTK